MCQMCQNDIGKTTGLNCASCSTNGGGKCDKDGCTKQYRDYFGIPYAVSYYDKPMLYELLPRLWIFLSWDVRPWCLDYCTFLLTKLMPDFWFNLTLLDASTLWGLHLSLMSTAMLYPYGVYSQCLDSQFIIYDPASEVCSRTFFFSFTVIL